MTLQSRLPLSNRVLPPADTKRWSPSRKAAVVTAARAGLITREEARTRYLLSAEELAEWERAFDRNGVAGLRTTRLQSYRYARPYDARRIEPDFNGAEFDRAAEAQRSR